MANHVREVKCLRELVIVKKFSVILCVGVILASCAGNSDKKEVKPLDTGSITEEAGKLAPKENVVHPGEAVYQKYCLQCHQADGSGVPGMHPPLWPNKWIKDKERLIEITLKGLSGEIEVDGEIYNNLMPPHSQLTDLQLANVISYVRTSFGNELGPVTQQEVAKARQKLK